MKVNITYFGDFKTLPTFEEFCDKYGIDFEIKERKPSLTKGGIKRWYAIPEPWTEIAENSMLISVHGDGDTPAEALADFAHRIKGKTLVQHLGMGTERRFDVPSGWNKFKTKEKI